VGFKWFLFFVAHAPLFFLMFYVRQVATFHTLIVFAVGLYFALRGQAHRVAYITAYICGSEVLWRMTKSAVFWEFGKYATAALMLIVLIRNSRTKVPTMPMLYFIMLVPSSIITLTSGDFETARENVSFNLSGPFALFVCAFFFSNLTLTQTQLQKLFLMLISPVVGIGILTLLGTLTAGAIKFTGESNKATSGGFGPNQVSNMLGLGALLAFLYLQDAKANKTLRAFMFGGMVFMAMQSAMTFSRGGLYNAAGGAILAVLFMFRDAKSRLKLIVSILLFFVVVNELVLPALNEFTGGTLLARFQDTNVTGRDELVNGDVQLFMENPIFGVGPGMAKWERDVNFMAAAAHTEFTRLFSEHGSFGVIALLLLIGIAIKSLRRGTTYWHQALIVALVGWAFIFMFNAAMRLVAPAFILGLTMLTLVPSEEGETLTGPNLSAIPRATNALAKGLRQPVGTGPLAK
jgi:hypothetical protein